MSDSREEGSAQCRELIQERFELPQFLKQVIKSQKIPNAFLFTGNPDSGRRSAALNFFQTVNCNIHGSIYAEATPCNGCSSCKKILAGMHPDCFVIGPVKNIIRIAQIRDLQAAIAVKPNEARWRMILIEQADTMNVQASNALLKMLEEPPLRTFFILSAQSLTSMLPTVISRCRHLSFKPMSLEKIRKELADHYKVSFPLAHAAAAYSNGSMDKARMFANISEKPPGTDWANRRQWLIHGIYNLMALETKMPDFASLLLMAERLDKNPELLKDSFTVLKSFIRDIAVCRFDPDAVDNIDMKELLKTLMRSLTLDKVHELIKALHQAERMLDLNTASRTTLEAALIKLSAI